MTTGGAIVRQIVTTAMVCAVYICANSSVAQAISFQVFIQPVQVCMDDATGCAQVGFFEDETDKIWAQADLDMQFLPTLQLNETDFLSISLGANEHVDLYVAGNAIAGDPATTMAINMYFVDDITNGPGTTYGLGCGAAVFATFCGNETGVIIADEVFTFNGGVGRLDTIAHEVGHVLGLTHDGFGAGGGENLMTAGSSRIVPSTIDDIAPDGANLDQLTLAQLDEALSSAYVKSAPEPGALLLLAMGFLMLVYLARRHGCRA